jgi:hypothetical protein
VLISDPETRGKEANFPQLENDDNLYQQQNVLDRRWGVGRKHNNSEINVMYTTTPSPSFTFAINMYGCPTRTPRRVYSAL